MEDFDAFLARYEAANGAFVNGDVTLWMPLVSHGADTSIFGGFGGHEVGWDQIKVRYPWASAQFRPSGARVRFDYLTKVVTGDLAFYTAIERSTVLLVNSDEPVQQCLWVTMVCRKEDGRWKIVHRHADDRQHAGRAG